MAEYKSINQLINARNVLIMQERQLYIESVERMNFGMREILNNDLGTTLVKNIGRDIAGEIVRNYFDFGDYYITVDQMIDRVVNFSYDDDSDIIMNDENIRKALYNFSDGINASSIKEITKSCEAAQKQLFTSDRAKDEMDMKGKKEYRYSKTNRDGAIFDELTGEKGSTKNIQRNGKNCQVSDLQADHIQARETIKYNEKYIREDRVEKCKEFYNSADNMQMIHASANASKGDVRVCQNKFGEIEYLNSKEMKNRIDKGEDITDISHRATSEQLAEAVTSQWEKETKSGNKTEVLKQKGYLNEDGKVNEKVKNELINNIRKAQNKESIEILKDIDYANVGKDAFKSTKKSMDKILAGQIIYYVMPPLIFETQSIIKRKDITLNNYYDELKKSEKRILNYVIKKIGEIIKNVFFNTLNKFLKTFFDFIINMVKATVKRLLKIVKDLVLSLVNCGKILMDSNSSAVQKADSISKIISTTITAVVIEVLFEYLEKQFGIPDFLMEPLQLIVTAIATNIIMLVLNKADLFDVNYGLMVSNIEKMLDEENERYLSSSKELLELGEDELNNALLAIKAQTRELTENISSLNIYKQESLIYLDKINNIFCMELDFEKEWNEFIKLA